MNDTTTEKSTFDVGKRLKSLRAKSGMTLRQLAGESGVAFTTIQKIESGAISPTVGILLKIARGLKIKITAMLEDEPEALSVNFIPKNKRIRASDARQDIEVQYIARNLINPEMFGFLLVVGPGEGSGPEPLLHGGEAIVIGLQGKITFTIEDEQYVVKPGDCLHFKANIPHRWVNSGQKPAKFYEICSETQLIPAALGRM
jgi:transcriptional regulator with XRE-family HTH domain